MGDQKNIRSLNWKAIQAEINNSNLAFTEFKDDFEVLAPGIENASFNSTNNTITLNGTFGTDPGVDGKVTLGAFDLHPSKKVKWTPDQIIYKVDNIPSGTYDAQVTVRGHKSNLKPVQITIMSADILFWYGPDSGGSSDAKLYAMSSLNGNYFRWPRPPELVPQSDWHSATDDGKYAVFSNPYRVVAQNLHTGSEKIIYNSLDGDLATVLTDNKNAIIEVITPVDEETVQTRLMRVPLTGGSAVQIYSNTGQGLSTIARDSNRQFIAFLQHEVDDEFSIRRINLANLQVSTLYLGPNTLPPEVLFVINGEVYGVTEDAAFGPDVVHHYKNGSAIPIGTLAPDAIFRRTGDSFPDGKIIMNDDTGIWQSNLPFTLWKSLGPQQSQDRIWSISAAPKLTVPGL
ncbi:MAG TPA: hypothetical protein PKW15_05215, partial [Alphaproteobacteria bacterium]|nr:hypothetical protein [Rhodospirillaceae bacterium]HRJ12625.1 hypothetical protein [Alphaproteobacteria bacterium]